MKVMIIVPHPDDEVLGFGGIIQKHVKDGDEVFVYFITDIDGINSPRAVKQIEQFPQVAKLLKYTGKVYDTHFDNDHFSVNTAELEKEIENFKPDVVYSTFYGDNHQDHEYVFRMVKIATRVWAKFLVKSVYLGEILSSTDQAPRLSQFHFMPNYYVPLTKKQVEKKIEALKCYTDEIQQWPHPRSEKGVLNLAEKRGSECKQEYAECFLTLRHIECC